MKKALDFARRRRWVRRLVNIEPGTRAVFKFPGKKKKKKDTDEDEDEDKQQVPRMYLTFKGSLICEVVCMCSIFKVMVDVTTINN